MNIGVIIARFQAQDLTADHKWLINFVRQKCEHLVILLGVSHVIEPSNALSFLMRKSMVEQFIVEHDVKSQKHVMAFDGQRLFDARVTILPLLDQPTDKQWSDQLDALLYHAFPGATFVLYGGRDSFIPHYKGRNKTFYIAQNNLGKSGTETRATCPELYWSQPYRCGVINTTKQIYRPPTMVDIAVVTASRQLLLGRKANEREWRLPGGAVEASDPDLDFAAHRELKEETGLVGVGPLEFIMSRRCSDWRYSHDTQPLTVLFLAQIGGERSITAKDDLVELKWCEFGFFDDMDIVANHIPLIHKIRNRLADCV